MSCLEKSSCAEWRKEGAPGGQAWATGLLSQQFCSSSGVLEQAPVNGGPCGDFFGHPSVVQFNQCPWDFLDGGNGNFGAHVFVCPRERTVRFLHRFYTVLVFLLADPKKNKLVHGPRIAMPVGFYLNPPWDFRVSKFWIWSILFIFATLCPLTPMFVAADAFAPRESVESSTAHLRERKQQTAVANISQLLHQWQLHLAGALTLASFVKRDEKWHRHDMCSKIFTCN